MSFECRSWIGAGFWGVPQVLAHELAHNLGLEHSGSQNAAGQYDQYGDGSSLMGACCSARCPSTPQAWQLGWLNLAQLDGSRLAAGKTRRVALASQDSSPDSGLRVQADWAPGVLPLFLGYRKQAGGDGGMDGSLGSKVHVYRADMGPRTASSPWMPAHTAWLTALAGELAPGRQEGKEAGSCSRQLGRCWRILRPGLPFGPASLQAAGCTAALHDTLPRPRPCDAVGESWEDPPTGLVVSVDSAAGDSATVRICRKGGADPTCGALLAQAKASP